MRGARRVACLLVFACGLSVAGATASKTTTSKAPVAHGSISLTRGLDVEDTGDAENGATSFAQMINYRNTQYTGTVYVGTPPQPFNVILDTGSANFWVYSGDCTSPACEAHHRFDHQASSTYSTNQTTFFVKYGSGRINGILCEDNIQLGSLVVPQQIFGAVTRETGSAFMWGKYDGILGLAFPTLAIEGSVPVLDTIMQQGTIPPMFSFFFSSGKTDSAFFVGGVPASYSNHVFTWHKVIRKGYWEIGLDDLLIGETSLAACPKHTSGVMTEKRNQRIQNRAHTKAAFERSSNSDHQSFAVEANMDLASGINNNEDEAVLSLDSVEEGFISELQSTQTEMAGSELEAQVWMAVSVSSAASVCMQTTASLAAQTQHTLQSRMCSQLSSTHRAQPVLKFPENDAQYTHDMRCKAAVDTGTSLITGPSEAINKLQALMGQVTNCNDLSGLPTVTFVIDGVNYPLTPEQYVLQFDAEDGQPASCLLGFKALDVPPPRGPLWVLGDVFMRAYFSVFDRSQNRIGFAYADVSPTAVRDPTPPYPNMQPLPIGIDTDKQIDTSSPQQPQPQTQQQQQQTADVSTSQFEVQAIPSNTDLEQQQQQYHKMTNSNVYDGTVHALDQDHGNVQEEHVTTRHRKQQQQHVYQHSLTPKQKRNTNSDEEDFWQQY